MEMKQGLRQTQQLQMNMQMQQSLKILQLNSMQLESELPEMAKENPIIDLDYGVQHEKLPSKLDPMAGKILDTDQSWDQSFLKSKTSNSIDGGEFLENFKDNMSFVERTSLEQENVPAWEAYDFSESSLYEDLENQLRLMRLADFEYKIVLGLVEYLDENGFLKTNLEEIVEETGYNKEDLESMLKVIQQCEPTGVGARSLQECFLLQLEALEEVPGVCLHIVKNYWELFEKQDFLKLSKALKMDIEETKEKIKFIKYHVDPRPARNYQRDKHLSISPDVRIVEYVLEGKRFLRAEYVDARLPKVRLNDYYQRQLEELNKQRLSRNSDDGVHKNCLKEYKEKADALIKALEGRKGTILSVMEEILKIQVEFFEKGPQYLKPMRLNQIAEALGLHESTISRATHDKYVEFRGCVFELKSFFSGSLENQEGGDVSPETVKIWVKELIEAERESKKAKSDQDLAEELERVRGIKVARRTVAKYREALGYLSSSKRGKLYHT